MPKKRVALLFHGVVGSKNRHGQLIDYARPLKTHYNNLYNNETCDLDVFMHVWDMNNTITDDQLKNDFKPTKFCKMKTIKEGIGETHWKTLNKNYPDNHNFHTKESCVRILERVNSQMFGLYYANELKRQYEKEKGFKYDFVIKTRYDLLLGYKPDFNKLSNSKFYSLPYNKHDKFHNGKKFITLTDFFWISGSDIMDEFVTIAPSFNDYLKNQSFIDYFKGKLEYGWIWHMLNKGIYNNIEVQDFIQHPIALDRFFNKNNEFKIGIKESLTGCLPFTGWKNKGLYSRQERKEKLNEIQKKIKQSVVGNDRQ